MNDNSDTFTQLKRIADALERLAPPPPRATQLDEADAFIWHAQPEGLEPVHKVNRIEVSLLKGIETQRETLLENTRRFAKGLPANNALLWGARGTGKSSLVKAVHAAINEELPHILALVEIHREDIPTLPRLLTLLRSSSRHVLLFCDDLSFDTADESYKSLKAVLEGGVEGRPTNVVFYATSNRRHLMSRDMIENERSTAIHPGETTEEKVSLSDRFGLWLGFHNLDQATFFAIIEGYAEAFGLPIATPDLHAQALEWSMGRGARSGRVAWQFIQDLAGRLGKTLG
ncbi:ATP-binding protein [Telmatospirillum sp.]|uniref:ATP-binding protein n=1 Tax=Telmatospirillum sp. TaxID=2079197 RepID=UPI0028521D66|nr:ATP-binding protein [Telmatospirillum sp.]MDR3435687.1 ATP-binding protein [Telmatospirillum sp.]